SVERSTCSHGCCVDTLLLLLCATTAPAALRTKISRSDVTPLVVYQGSSNCMSRPSPGAIAPGPVVIGSIVVVPAAWSKAMYCPAGSCPGVALATGNCDM